MKNLNKIQILGFSLFIYFLKYLLNVHIIIYIIYQLSKKILYQKYKFESLIFIF
jgi:hypothetical protein